MGSLLSLPAFMVQVQLVIHIVSYKHDIAEAYFMPGWECHPWHLYAPDRRGRRKEDIRRPMRFFSYVLLVLAVGQVNHGLLPGNSTAVVLPSSYEKAHSDEHAR